MPLPIWASCKGIASSLVWLHRLRHTTSGTPSAGEHQMHPCDQLLTQAQAPSLMPLWRGQRGFPGRK